MELDSAAKKSSASEDKIQSDQPAQAFASGAASRQQQSQSGYNYKAQSRKVTSTERNLPAAQGHGG